MAFLPQPNRVELSPTITEYAASITCHSRTSYGALHSYGVEQIEQPGSILSAARPRTDSQSADSWLRLAPSRRIAPETLA
jgi:hypothetical protein